MRRRSATPLSVAPATTETLVATENSLAVSVGQLDTVAAQLRRRKRASFRLPPMPDGRRDSLDRPAGEDLTPAALDAWALAIDHLLEARLCPIVPAAVRQARRGAS